VEIEPGSFLSYTLLDPRSTVADSPENYLTITWKLKAAEEGALLPSPGMRKKRRLLKAGSIKWVFNRGFYPLFYQKRISIVSSF
jgi:hypothetical protein